MKQITKETVEHVAQLARLKFSPSQLETYTQRFKRVLEYFEKLNELDTSQVEPMSHATAAPENLREDAVKTFDKTDEILKIAPERDERFVKVPKVI